MKSILIILLSIAPTLAWTITPKVILLSPQLDYCKQYQNILEIPTNIIEWRLDATGEGKERATYFTQVHMTNHRSCGVVFNKADMSWDDIQTLVFRHEDLAGCYYIKNEIHLDGKVYEDRLYIHCKVPPVKPFSLPYTPPTNNQPPVPVLKILNYESGLQIKGRTVYFTINQTYDPDGSMTNAVMYWAIYTQGHHPIYVGVPRTRVAEETYIWPNEVEPVYGWDTSEAPSQDNDYNLYLVVIDEWGEIREINLGFTANPDSQPVNPPDLPPDAPQNVRLLGAR